MPQPRKYATDAERYVAYRERKKERIEEMARQLYLIDRAKERERKAAKKRPATATTPGPDIPRQALIDLRGMITEQIRGIGLRDHPDRIWWLIDDITAELDHLLGIPNSRIRLADRKPKK